MVTRALLCNWTNPTPSASTWQPRSVWLLVQPCQALATSTGKTGYYRTYKHRLVSPAPCVASRLLLDVRATASCGVLGGRSSALDTASTTSPRVPAERFHVATTARRRPHYSAMLTDGVRNPVPVPAHSRRLCLCSLSQHLRHVRVALDHLHSHLHSHSLSDPPNVQPRPYLDTNTNATLRARIR